MQAFTEDGKCGGCGGGYGPVRSRARRSRPTPYSRAVRGPEEQEGEDGIFNQIKKVLNWLLPKEWLKSLSGEDGAIPPAMATPLLKDVEPVLERRPSMTSTHYTARENAGDILRRLKRETGGELRKRTFIDLSRYFKSKGDEYLTREEYEELVRIVRSQSANRPPGETFTSRSRRIFEENEENHQLSKATAASFVKRDLPSVPSFHEADETMMTLNVSREPKSSPMVTSHQSTPVKVIAPAMLSAAKKMKSAPRVFSARFADDQEDSYIFETVSTPKPFGTPSERVLLADEARRQVAKQMREAESTTKKAKDQIIDKSTADRLDEKSDKPVTIKAESTKPLIDLSTPFKPSFSFNIPLSQAAASEETTKPFTFGAKEEAAAVEAPSKSEDQTATMSFGIGELKRNDAPVVATPAFSFGKQKDAKSVVSAAPSFTFGVVKDGGEQTESKRPATVNLAKPIEASSKFEFTKDRPIPTNEDQGLKKQPTSGFTFGFSTTTPSTSSLATKESDIKPAFTFGSSSVAGTEPPTAQSFSFGSSSETPETKRPAFSFGATSAASAPKLSFTFGQDAKSTTTPTADTSKPVHSFASTAPSFSFTHPQPFAEKTTTTGFTFGSQPFGQPTNISPPAPAATPSFGQSSVPSFGSMHASEKSSTFSFGAAEAKPFSFAPPAFGTANPSVSSFPMSMEGPRPDEHPPFGGTAFSAPPAPLPPTPVQPFAFTSNAPVTFDFGGPAMMNSTSANVAPFVFGSAPTESEQTPSFSAGSATAGRKISRPISRRR